MPQPRIDSIVVRNVKFSNGQISQSMFADVLHPKWQSSLRTCKNWLPIPQGPLVSRPGSKIIQAVKDSGKIPILRQFVFSDALSYVLEIGELYIRAYHNGAYVGEIVNPTAFTFPMLPYLKMKQVGNVITFTYGGQSNGTPAIPPQDLRYDPATATWTYGATPLKGTLNVFTGIGGGAFRIDILPFNPAFTYNRGDRVTTTAVGTTLEWYATQDGITGAPQAPPNPPGVMNTAGAAGTGVDISGNLFWTPVVDSKHTADDLTYIITKVVQDQFGITYESNPAGQLVFTKRTAAGLDRWLRVLFTPDAEFGYQTLGFNVYKKINDGLAGFVSFIPWRGIATYTFTDDGATPDYTVQPPLGTDPFLVSTGGSGGATTDSYPSIVGYLDQRRLFAASKLVPVGVWLSQDGDFAIWDRPTPGADTDSIFITIAGEVLEQPRAFMPMRRGILMTGQSEWTLSGLNGGGISRTSKELKWQSGWGSGWLDPLKIGTGLIFCTALGDIVRDFFPLYGIYSDIWDGQELSFMARDFFDRHSIVDWAYQPKPYPVVWAVRDDGVLLSLTYQHAPPSFGQQLAEGICAWAQHTTGADFQDSYKSVCCVPEPPEMAVYTVVQRGGIGGTSYVERFANPVQPTDQKYSISLDSCRTRDGRNTGSKTIKLSGGVAYAAGDVVTCTASANFRPNPTEGVAAIEGWDVKDPGHASIVLDPDGQQGNLPVEAKIVAVTSSLVCTVELQQSLTANQKTRFVTGSNRFWGDATDYNRYLDFSHISAHPVDTFDVNLARGFCVLADGDVAQILSWAAGVYQIGVRALVHTAGLSYNCDVELLDAHHPSQDIRNIFKRLTRIGFEVTATRGVWAGASLDNLWEWDQRNLVDAYGMVPLASGYYEAEVTDSWSKDGRGALRHIDPLPATLMSALREFATGGS